ncbi:MAG: FixH family protein [Planctomycetota bacterium]
MNEGQTTQGEKRNDAASPKRFLMPGLVIGFLATHMLFIFIAISLAVGDRSFAVVPDYYQKAVDWDERKELLAASEALGWSAEILPAREVSMHGERELLVKLLDREGRPIESAHVAATLYPITRAKQLSELTLQPADEPGQYTAIADMRQEGVWHITLYVTRGDAFYLQEEKTFVRGSYEGGTP